MQRITLFILLCTGTIASWGQILDDSSKLVYGPSTLNVIHLEDIKDNLDKTRWIDTTLTDLEKYTYVNRYNRQYVNLGNNGTAMLDLFRDLPTTIGATSGYSVYDPLVPSASRINYYNTRSPYINMFILFGGHGRSMASVHYTQNVNPDWNVGFTISRSVSDKQIGAEQSRGDRNVESTQLDFFTYYSHPKLPYKLMFNIISFTNDVDETGGILLGADPEEYQKYRYQDNSIRLDDVFAVDRRLNYHLYHEYGLFKQFQLYHQLDGQQQRNEYRDFEDPGISDPDRNPYNPYYDFYDQFLIDADSTYERSRFGSFANEVGLKGSISSIFYRFYIRNRIVNQERLFLGRDATLVENYIGGVTQFRWRDLFSVNGEVELLQTGEFRAQGSLRSNLINVSYTSTLFKPSNLSQKYFANHFEWSKSFQSTFANDLTGSLDFKTRMWRLAPFASIKTYNNLVYFGLDQTPSQTSGGVVLTRLGGDIDFHVSTNRERKSGFHFENELYHMAVSGESAEVIQVPELFYNGRYYWKGSIFKQTVPIEVGFSLHSKTAYFANAYSPSIQQFYLQRNEKLDAYFAADAFLNMRVSRLYIFVQMIHANQPNEGGYFITPGYPGQQRSFDLGVRWLFFD